MSKDDFKITKGGVAKMIAIMVMVLGGLIGAVKGYTILTEKAKTNSVAIKKIEDNAIPQIRNNDKRLVKIETELSAIKQRQNRMLMKQDKSDDKLDRILEKIK